MTPPPDAEGEEGCCRRGNLSYGANLDPEVRGKATQFMPVVEADHLIRTDPFAFLAAVICDQGVQAEHGWEAPYLLK